MEGSGRRKVVIMWKPLGKNEANGKILGYRAYCLCKGKKEDIPQCHNNLSTDCRLDITKEKCSVFLSAYNSVGESPQSKIVFPPANQAALPPSLNVNASPAGDDSLLIKWESPSLPTTGHIIEWCQVSDKSDRVINWHFQPGNSSQGVIKENIEPARLYNISVHVLYNGEVVTQGYTQSYSKQSAPLSGPEVKPKQIWNWKAEVEWDEIQIDDRCGFIRNYTIFCGDKEGRFKSVSVNSSVYRYNISGLTENSIYQIFIMASTDGGSTNGSILTLKTKPIERENKMLVILLFTGITLIIITSVLTCIYQKQFFKKYLWPKVPSPAESTLAGWIPTHLWMGGKSFKGQHYPGTQLKLPISKPNTSDEKIHQLEVENIHYNKIDKESLQSFSSWLGSTYCTIKSNPSYFNSAIKNNQDPFYQNKAEYAMVITYRSIWENSLPDFDSSQPFLQSGPQENSTFNSQPYQCPWFPSVLGTTLIQPCQEAMPVKNELALSSNNFPLLMALIIDDGPQFSQNHVTI
nr:PREDICTED: interleukin-6 receptor subunit beta-like [Latimeria chalumnae]|eukprot:XP_005999552.1 PREDICTED: interleukin-6 receptor subunit beta-like [Latimeria chalumnae]